MSESAQVWITRAEPGASATAARLSTLGFKPLIAPLLSVQVLAATLDLQGVGALAFTSRNGVQAFCARTPGRDLPVFAVGDATAQAARAAGFGQVTSAHNDVFALARLIAEAQPAGAVLHPAGVHRAGDLVGDLRRAGIDARSVTLYDTPAVKSVPPIAAEALLMRNVGAILLHSPRAAAILASVAGEFALADVPAVGLSAACLAPLKPAGFAKVIAAAAPREAALIDALFVALGKSPDRR